MGYSTTMQPPGSRMILAIASAFVSAVVGLVMRTVFGESPQTATQWVTWTVVGILCVAVLAVLMSFARRRRRRNLTRSKLWNGCPRPP